MSRAKAAAAILPSSTSSRFDRRARAAVAFVGLGFGVGVVACGGAAEAPATSPKSPAVELAPAQEPSSIEEAQEQIARARAELGAPSPRRETTSDAPGADATEKPTRTTPSAGSSAGDPKAPVSEAKPTDACGGSCRALASMKRAVIALCRMTGDADTRCGDARRTLAESESRVATCRCSS